MTSTGNFIQPSANHQSLSSTDGGRGRGSWLPLTTSEFFSFLWKTSLHSENSKKHFLCPQLVAHRATVGTRDSLQSLVVQTETYCVPIAKGKSKLKLSLGLRGTRRSLEEKWTKDSSCKNKAKLLFCSGKFLTGSFWLDLPLPESHCAGNPKA